MPSDEYKDKTPDDSEDGVAALQYYSYWVVIDLLLPNTMSRLEEHTTTMQGVSVFRPVDDQMTVGALVDGGNALALVPNQGGRLSSSPNILLASGTDTAFEWTSRDGATPGYWSSTEGQQTLIGGGTGYDAKNPRQVLPDDINRIVEVNDLNGDGVKDLIYCTQNGAYVSLTDGSNNVYKTPILLSNEIQNVNDAASLDYNNDGAMDIVVIGGDDTLIYRGDPTDLGMNNMGVNALGGLVGTHLAVGGLKDGVRVEVIDTTGDLLPDSIVIGRGENSDDLIYFQGSFTGVTIPGSTGATRDVSAARMNSEPNEPLIVVFAKNGVNTALQIPRDSTGIAYSTYAHNQDLTSWWSQLDSLESRDTHTLKFVGVLGSLFNQQFTNGGTLYYNLYEGYTKLSSDTNTGNYYYNSVGKPGPNKGQICCAGLAELVGGKSFINPGLTEANLQQFTGMEVMTLDVGEPPSLVLVTNTGCKVVLTQHTPSISTSHSDPRLYDFVLNSNLDIAILTAGGHALTDEISANSYDARDIVANLNLLVVADLNDDTFPDVLSGVHVVLSDAGHFESSASNPSPEHLPQKYWQGPAPLAVMAQDADQDGDVDIVAVTRLGRIVVVVNDGSGQFGKLTQQRVSSNLAPFAMVTTYDDTLSPRILPFYTTGVALATLNGLCVFKRTGAIDSLDTVTYETPRTPLGSALVIDMKTAHFNGSPGGLDDLVVLTADGQVRVVRGTILGGQAEVVTLIGVGVLTDPMRIGIGNLLGNPPRSTESLHGRVDNSGAVVHSDMIDPRSLDIVVATKSKLYAIGGTYDSVDAVTKLTQNPLAELTIGGDTPVEYTVTALEVKDMDGNGMADIVLGFNAGVWRSIVYTHTTLIRPLPTDLGGDDVTHAATMLSPIVTGAGMSQGTADAKGTTRMIVADVDRDGNYDLVYTSDANEAARVSYARPVGNEAPTSSEINLSPAITNQLDIMRVGMLAWIDEAMKKAFDDGHSQSQGFTSSGLNSLTNADFIPQRYEATLTAGEDPTPATVNGIVQISDYMAPVGTVIPVANSATANHISGQNCRAPTEQVVPVKTHTLEPFTAHSHTVDTHSRHTVQTISGTDIKSICTVLQRFR